MKSKAFVIALLLFVGFGAFLAGGASAQQGAKQAFVTKSQQLEQDFKQELERRLASAEYDKARLEREIEERKAHGGWTSLEKSLIEYGADQCPNWAVEAMLAGTLAYWDRCGLQIFEKRRKNGTH